MLNKKIPFITILKEKNYNSVDYENSIKYIKELENIITADENVLYDYLQTLDNETIKEVCSLVNFNGWDNLDYTNTKLVANIIHNYLLNNRINECDTKYKIRKLNVNPWTNKRHKLTKLDVYQIINREEIYKFLTNLTKTEISKLCIMLNVNFNNDNYLLANVLFKDFLNDKNNIVEFYCKYYLPIMYFNKKRD